MAKKATNDVDKTKEVNTTPVEVAKPRVLNLVTMEDGTQVNFGNRANLVTAMDLDTATISFKLSTGKIISWVVTDLVDSLTDFQKKVLMYGLLEKVKSSLAPVKKEDLTESIDKQIAAIAEGTFNLRSTGSTAVTGLTMIMRAYAMAKVQLQEEFAHWADLEDATVISEVFADWSAKSVSEKNTARKNPYVQSQLGLLEIAANPETAKAL